MPADVTVDEVRTALKDVYDPEIPVNVLDLGLIYNIDVDDENTQAAEDGSPVATLRMRFDAWKAGGGLVTLGLGM